MPFQLLKKPLQTRSHPDWAEQSPRSVGRFRHSVAAPHHAAPTSAPSTWWRWQLLASKGNLQWTVMEDCCIDCMDRLVVCMMYNICMPYICVCFYAYHVLSVPKFGIHRNNMEQQSYLYILVVLVENHRIAVRSAKWSTLEACHSASWFM